MMALFSEGDSLQRSSKEVDTELIMENGDRILLTGRAQRLSQFTLDLQDTRVGYSVSWENLKVFSVHSLWRDEERLLSMPSFSDSAIDSFLGFAPDLEEE